MGPKTIEGEILSLIDDIVPVLFEREPTRFLKAHYIPVSGTEQSLVTFQFDGEAFNIAFDAEINSALRARGFELLLKRAPP